MLPLFDVPRDPDFVPWVTRLLIVVNVVVALVTLPLAFYDTAPLPGGAPTTQLQVLFETWGFRATAPGLSTTFTSLFLHGDIVHVLGNMLFLGAYAPNVEQRMGRVGFVALYLTAGVLATLLFALVSLGNPAPLIGASGAISGVLGAYLALFPRNRMHVLLVVVPVLLPAWFVLACYVLLDNLVPLLVQQTTVVAHSAHLGGFFVGALLGIGLRVVDPRGLATNTPSRPARDPLSAVDVMIQQGMLLDAHRRLQELARGEGPTASGARERLQALRSTPAFQSAARLLDVPLE